MTEDIYWYTTVFLVLFVFTVIILERKYPFTKGLPVFREGFWVDLIWYTFIQSYVLKILIFGYIIRPLQQRLDSFSIIEVGTWPVAIQVLFFLVLHDFYIYWFHRWQHHSKLLWRTHEAHHSNTQVDWLSGSRSHSVEIIINQTVEFAPIVLLAAHPAVLPVKALLDAVWGMFIHSNIDVKRGKWEYIINGPRMHQWHHADDKKVFYANYATKFSVWDWLFKTAYLPDHKPTAFGLHYAFPKDYFLQHFFAFKRFDENKLAKGRILKHYFVFRRKLAEWIVQRFNQTK